MAKANEKKPSIYDDRGTIGSSAELDQYGVWVKSEPQDLSSAGIETDDTSDLSSDISGADDFDMAIPDIGDLPDFDTLETEASAASLAGKSKYTDLDELPEDDFELPDMEPDFDTEPEDEIEETGGIGDLDFSDFSEQDDSSDIEIP